MVIAADLIFEARQRSGASQRELARRARTSQATVAAYEAGRKQPSFEVLERLVAAAGLRLDVTLRAPRRVASAPGHPTYDWERASDEERGMALRDLLELADRLPHRRPGRLEFPGLQAKR